jgi:hypothetical protein
VRRNGRDITFGGTIRISPAVAALLQRHASERLRQDVGAEPCTSPEDILETPADGEEGDSQAEAEVEEPPSAQHLPAGLTSLILKGCGASESGAVTAAPCMPSTVSLLVCVREGVAHTHLPDRCEGLHAWLHYSWRS